MDGVLDSSLPAWAIFAIVLVKVVLDWAAKRDEAKRTAEGAAAMPTNKPPTSEEIAAVIRDQDERREILELLREQGQTNARIAESIETVSSAMERIARTQDTQTQLIERQAVRTRALAESAATSRQVLDRIERDIVSLQSDVDELRTTIGAPRRPPTASGTQPPPRGEGT